MELKNQLVIMTGTGADFFHARSSVGWQPRQGSRQRVTADLDARAQP